MKENDVKISSYLSFKLGEEEFATHVNSVLNILEMTKITGVPKAPDYMKGVINLRGTVLPVVDLRLKFGMDKTVYTDNTCIIVMEINIDNEKVLVGSLVDAVMSVVEIDDDKVLPPPNIGNKYRSEFINGMVNIDNKFIMILNMENVFSSDELIVLKENIKQEVENN